MAHRRAVKLDGVVFDYPLYVKEYEEPDDFMAEVLRSTVGTDIVYVARVFTPPITLLSKESGWLSLATVNGLKAIFDTIGVAHTLTYEDGQTEQVRVAHERKPVFSELFECSDQFLVMLPLAKIQ